MQSTSQPDEFMSWKDQAYQLLCQGKYEQSANLYEQVLELDPTVKSSYWYLGLALLLQEKEVEAQTVWFIGLSDEDSTQSNQWLQDLFHVLDTETSRREALSEFSIAWAIRQHMRELEPSNLRNLLHLVWLAIQLQTLTANDLAAFDVISLLRVAQKDEIEVDLLLQVLEQVLKYFAPDPIIIDFAEASLHIIDDLSDLMAVLLPASVQIAYELKHPKLAANLLELYCLKNDSNIEILGHLSAFYQNTGCFDDGIRIAKSRLDLADNLPEKVFSSHLLLRAFMTAGGYWQDALVAMERHQQLMHSLIETSSANLSHVETIRMFTASYFLPYFKDNLKANRSLQNQMMALCQKSACLQPNEKVKQYQTQTTGREEDSISRPLKIAYLSHCMGRHSVGWLARWLIQHHNREQFELCGYFINSRKNDMLHDWYVSQMHHVYWMSVESSNDSKEVAEKIYQDKVDILVDLDSLTLDLSCHILSLKPASIQVSWLGWDASGIPAVDYFIADPYVLPDWAQDYYPETIWRLPRTYIAVDGFEVDVPNLQRDQLSVPSNAIIYLSCQKGYKRHPETARLQMKVIKAVPNSYFLIKGSADQKSIQRFFEEIAEVEGVALNRLRFLPETPTEAIHRANLGIADVVLDTYPYNGATTTLETLWMGIPLVTRVGEQFAARNSYTMLMNVGVQEGIAWTDEEYVEWGVRFGTDEALRQQVHWKLRQSRHTAPLWNAKQFTRDMENAYRQMWQIYCEGGKRV